MQQEPELKLNICDMCRKPILKKLHINLICSPPYEYYKVVEHHKCNELRSKRYDLMDELNDLDDDIDMLREPSPQ
jgi:hypothetical protein